MEPLSPAAPHRTFATDCLASGFAGICSHGRNATKPTRIAAEQRLGGPRLRRSPRRDGLIAVVVGHSCGRRRFAGRYALACGQAPKPTRLTTGQGIGLGQIADGRIRDEEAAAPQTDWCFAPNDEAVAIQQRPNNRQGSFGPWRKPAPARCGSGGEEGPGSRTSGRGRQWGAVGRGSRTGRCCGGGGNFTREEGFAPEGGEPKAGAWGRTIGHGAEDSSSQGRC